jgi:hypothetical protein
MARKPSREAEAAAEQEQRRRYAGASLAALVDELIRRGAIAPEHRDRLLARIEEKVADYFRMLGFKIGRDIQKAIDETLVFNSFMRTVLRHLDNGGIAIESDVFAYIAQILRFKISDYAARELGRSRRPAKSAAAAPPARRRRRTTAFSEMTRPGGDGSQDGYGGESDLAVVHRLYELPDSELAAEVNWLAERIDRLPELHREVLRMKYQGYEDAEIDAKLGSSRPRGRKVGGPSGAGSGVAGEGQGEKAAGGRPNWVKHTLADAFWALCLACGRCPRCRELLPRGGRVTACPNPACGTTDPKTGELKPTSFTKKVRQMAAGLDEA